MTIIDNETMLPTWEDFVSELKKEESPANASQRKLALSEAITNTDIDRLLDLKDKMSAVIDQITFNNLSEFGNVLSSGQASALMREELEQKEILELLEIRRSMRRTAIFSHMTEMARRDGENDPERSNTSLVVDEFKKKFVRQGGRKKFALDQAKLASGLGELAKEIFIEKVIPERVEYEVDTNKLMSLAASKPEILEVLRESVVPAGVTPLSLFVRDAK